MTLSEHAERFGGVYALMLTPFKQDRSIDYDVYPEYVRWQEHCGAMHLFPVCGSSEMMELTLAEREKMARLTVENKKNASVIATANLEPSWEAQLEEIKRIEATGVDALVFVTKSYGNDDERMYAYMSELASHATLPILIYEFPGFPHNKMSGEVYGKLVKSGRFVGIKDTTCVMEGKPGILEKIAVQGDSCVLQANIPYLLEAYQAGARGVIATPSTCGVGILRKMWDAFVAGDGEAAQAHHADVCSLSDVMDVGFNRSAKYLINLQGIPFKSYSRSNLNDLSAQAMKDLRVWHDAAVRKGIWEK